MRRSTGLWVMANTVGVAPVPDVVITRPPVDHAVDMVILVSDRYGKPLGELQTHGAIDSVTWRIDGHSALKMTLSPDIQDDKPELVMVGNKVLIYFTNGLPDWGGVMDLPIEYSDRAIDVTLYSAEYMLNWPLTPRMYHRTAFARDILADLAAMVDLPGEYGISVVQSSYLETGGDDEEIEAEFSFEPLASVIGKLQDKDPLLHYFIRPAVYDGRVNLDFIVYRGELTEVPDARLLQGHNFVGVGVLDQGPIFNEFIVAGQGTDFNEGGATYFTVGDEESGRRFYRRGKFLAHPLEDANSGQLAVLGYGELRKYAAPRTRFRGRLLDLPPAEFQSIGLGQRVTAELQWPPPDGVTVDVTVIGMEYEPGTGTLNLVVEYAGELTA